MAVTALHIVLESPEPLNANASSYLLTALEYHNAACKAFREVDRSTKASSGYKDEEDFTTVFAFQVINLVFTLGSFNFHIGNSQDKLGNTSMLENIPILFRLCDSMGSVIKCNLDKFVRGPMPVNLNVFEESRWREIDQDTELAFARLRGIVDETRIQEDGREIFEATSRAVDWLETCFGFYTDTHRDVVLIWPMALGDAFVQALERGDSQTCRLVLLHWAVLLHWLGRGGRFTRNLGLKVVAELCEVLPRKDRQWQESINWVQQQIKSS